MKILVQKFGGTSVATVERRRQVVHKISAELKAGYQVIVVVSAMGRQGEAYATDTLLSLVGAQNPVISKKDLDLLMACGEIISGVVLASDMEREGIEATCLTGGQAGIITNDCFTDARILKVKPKEILKELENGKVVIVAGFQGMTEEGKVTTLGRGGSDTTAAALGVALNAERVDIYTDVDGVKTADPRIVDEAKTLTAVTYNEICQLAREGAKVIHPRAVEIAMQANIPLCIKNTFSEAAGTWVTSGAGRGGGLTDITRDRVITGITQKENISQLVIVNAAGDDSLPMKAFQSLADADISVDFISICTEKVMLTVKDEERDQAMSLLRSLGFTVTAKENCAKVAAVGAAMTGVPGVMAGVVEALTESGIKILQSADSYTTIWCLVEQKDMKNAVRALHTKFKLG